MIYLVIVILAATACIVGMKKVEAGFQAPLDIKSIQTYLKRDGTSYSVISPWIVFDHQGKEYAINTSTLPVLVVIKQTSLEGFQKSAKVLREVAQDVSLDTVMTTVHIEGDPASRAVIQLNAIETCVCAFDQRLGIYLEIIDETERRFFEEVGQKQMNE